MVGDFVHAVVGDVGDDDAEFGGGGMSMLSTPMPYREATMHFSAARRTLPVTWAKQNMMMSASVASSARVCSEVSGATIGSTPAALRTSDSTSMFGQTLVGDECFFVGHVFFVLVGEVLIRLG